MSSAHPVSNPDRRPIVEMINTGTEILLGEVLNTHVRDLARLLFPLGLRLERQQTLPDGVVLKQPLSEAIGRVDVVIVTGGLGPTTDDITRELTAELLGLPLVEDPSVLQSIRARLAARGRELLPRMHRQAMVPAGARVLPNHFGTAPGLAITHRSPGKTTHLFLLPGPPRELLPMFQSEVIPFLEREFPLSGSTAKAVFRIQGIGESAVEARLGLELSENPELEVGYCARPGEVDLRLVGPPEAVGQAALRIRGEFGDLIVPTDRGPLEEVLVAELARRGQSLSTAESCTGGSLAGRITDVPGASEVFLRGYVTYSNRAKIEDLGVPPDLLEVHGAVSREVAEAMASGAKCRADTDFAISLTGIAGPTGGTPAKPVGTVHIGIASAAGVSAHQIHILGDRLTFKKVAIQRALDLLIRQVSE